MKPVSNMIQKVKINTIKNNESNPRFIKDYKFKKLVKSINEFPEMLKLRPIVVNNDMVVLGGNMRLKACKEAGLKEVYILKADELTEKQQREFIVKDNVGFGDWDWEVLANEWDNGQLQDWGLDLVGFDEDLDSEPEEKEDVDLSDKIEETFEVIITCGNESEQEATFEELTKKGYICRVLTL